MRKEARGSCDLAPQLLFLPPFMRNAMKIPYKLAVLLHKLDDADCGPVVHEGGEFRCCCPAHEDSSPSLYITFADSKILINCKAGCEFDAICNRLDHPKADMFFDDDEPFVEHDTESEHLEQLAATAPEEPAMEKPVVDSEIRHAVYSELLEKLEIGTAHFDDLKRRGLTGKEINQRGYKSTDSAKIRQAVDVLLAKHERKILLTVPGFQDKNGSVLFFAGSGCLIPVRDTDGSVIALKLRRDDGAPGAKYTWVSSKDASCGSPVHVPLGIKPPLQEVRVTEGELKADVSTFLSNLPTVSAPGVGNWGLTIPTLKKLAVKKVLIAFDQDGKSGTLKAMEKAILGLAGAGFEVALEWWDSKSGKGIDDLLNANGKPEILDGLKALVRLKELTAEACTTEAKTEETAPEPFPVNVFPPALARYSLEVAEATGTPLDFAAMTMLVTAGAAIGNSRALCLKENVWYEGPRIYAVNVGDPASGKSPAMDAVVKPYQGIQFRLIKEYKEKLVECTLIDAERNKIAQENRTLATEERKSVPDLPELPKEPERFVVVDATVESLAPLLEKNPRGLLMPQDEGVAWVRGMGQYKGGRGNDRQFWLSTWSGKPHMVDRKSQGLVPVSIPLPFINVICGLPPDLLNELADYQGRNDGFLHRILFVFPDSLGAADWSEASVSTESKDAWEDTLKRLRALQMGQNEDGVAGVVRFSTAAKARWAEWWNAHAAEMRGQELSITLLGPWGKLKSYAARLALILHYLWHVQVQPDLVELDVDCVNRAVSLVNYLKAHLRRVYGRLRQTPDENHVFEVMDWIRKHGGKCRARDLVHAKKVTPTEKAKKMLKELEERGYGRLNWEEATNHKKVEWFVLELQ